MGDNYVEFCNRRQGAACETDRITRGRFLFKIREIAVFRKFSLRDKRALDLWVFAYGSLMWRPGFRYEEATHALLEGARRALCLYSVVHRGVPSAPGLVFGLDKGGRCEGMVYRVAKERALDTQLYLQRRENVTNTYHATMRPVTLLDGSARGVNALCFIVDRRNSQYAGRIPLEAQAWLVRRSAGKSGANIDYVVNTMLHLRELGVHDPDLERLMSMLGHELMKARLLTDNGGRLAFNGRRSVTDFARPIAARQPVIDPPLNAASATAI